MLRQRGPLGNPELGNYGIAESQVERLGYNPMKSPKGTPFPAGKKRGGGGGGGRGRGRRRGFNHFPKGVHFMDSGVDELNEMFPTLSSLPPDVFMAKIRNQQMKNASPNGWFTTANLGSGGTLGTGYVGGVQTLWDNMSQAEKDLNYATSYGYGGGNFNSSIGGPLSPFAGVPNAVGGYDHGYDDYGYDDYSVGEYDYGNDDWGGGWDDSWDDGSIW